MNTTFKTNTEKDSYSTKEQIEYDFLQLIDILSDSKQKLDKIYNKKGVNQQFYDIVKPFLMSLEDDVENAKTELTNSMQHIPWDKLVVAFFGETNAGKSTIIETFRILFDINRIKGQDGKIVGDGRHDFTKDYNEYELQIGNKPFVLIDVPGIEGDENAFKDTIKDALHKAHCIYYVQGHNKKPDEATAIKIKQYLGDWVNVYSIQNVRGAVTDYDEEDERQSLLTESVKKNGKLIQERFVEILGDVYKGNTAIQALLAMCAKATFSSDRMDLRKTQEKLFKYFDNSEQLMRFSQFDSLISLTEQKASNFAIEIAEANRQKMLSLVHEAINGLNANIENVEGKYANFDSSLKEFKRNVLSDFNYTKNSIKTIVDSTISSSYNGLLQQLYSIVDSDCSNDIKKSKVLDIAHKFPFELQIKIKNNIGEQLTLLKDKISSQKKKLSEFSIGEFESPVLTLCDDIDEEDCMVALEELNVQFKDVSEVLGLAGAGASVGGFGGFIGIVIGAVVGAGVGVAKKMIFGDGGKGDAKKILSQSIENSKQNAINQYTLSINRICKRIEEQENALLSNINEEILLLNTFNKKITLIKDNLEDYFQNINHKQYDTK